MYTPENQYRCTIIRGKSQTEMEDLLPVYANIVHKYCPCTEETFRNSAFSDLSYTLFHTREFSKLPKNKQKTDGSQTENGALFPIFTERRAPLATV